MLFIHPINVISASNSNHNMELQYHNYQNTDNLVPTQEEECLVPCNKIGQLLLPDSIPAIDDPKFVTPEDIDNNKDLKDTSFVIGVVIDGVARVYPYNILNYHEIVNDRINEENLVITYCPLTGSGISFYRSNINNSSFGVSGSLFENNLIMYDRQSESYWSQMMAQSITGPEIGHILNMSVSIETTWRAWKSLYPNSEILGRNAGIYRSSTYDVNPYFSYSISDSIRFRSSYDKDNPPFNLYTSKTKTMITTINNQTMLFPFSELTKYSVVNERLDETSFVIVFDPFNDLSLAFSVKISDGTILSSFEQATFQNFHDNETFGLPVFKDSSGTIWNFKGEAIDGKYKGKRLTQLATYNAYWFAASVFYPDAKIYPRDALSTPKENSIDLMKNRDGKPINTAKSGISFLILLPLSLTIIILVYRRQIRPE